MTDSPEVHVESTQGHTESFVETPDKSEQVKTEQTKVEQVTATPAKEAEPAKEETKTAVVTHTEQVKDGAS